MSERHYTFGDLLARKLPGLPESSSGLKKLIVQRGWRSSHLAREGAKGWEYHLALLPPEAQATLLAEEMRAQGPASAPVRSPDDPDFDLWRAFEQLPEAARATAAKRLGIVEQVVELRSTGVTAMAAVALVARRVNAATSTLWGWLRLVEGVPRAHWLAALAPQHKGRTATADCDPRAWDFLVADYLRAERPSFAACHRRLVEAAAANGWGPIPASKTLQRRLEALPKAVTTLARFGGDAAARLYPHQTRDRSGFAAMQAVNADGHQFDVFCRFEDGSIGRPVMVGVQDLASGMIVGWRVAETENWSAVRHAFADAIGRFGIPQAAWLDNGRAFASKWMSGGQKTRFRFTIRDDEPAGILTQLGITVHWTTPYHGQAKPIERAWRDLAEEISRHPECAGAYTGNNVMAKPENYGSRAMPIAEFRDLVHRAIVRHNGQADRRGRGMDGRSFAEVFAESYERDAAWTRASDAQHRMLLMAAEGVTCRAPTGEIWLDDNRYWAEPLVDWAGKKVVVRFDPDNLHAPVGIYSRDGRLIAEANCIQPTGFADREAAGAHARNKRQYLKGQKLQLELERRLGIEAVAGLLPRGGEMPAPAGGVVQLPTVPRASAAPQPQQSSEADLSRAIRQLGEAADAASILTFPVRGTG